MRLFAKTRARRAAVAKYWALDRKLEWLHSELGKTEAAVDRAHLLWNLSRVQLDQADVHDAAFGPDLLKRDAAGTMAQSLHWSAMLYRLLAGVDDAAAYAHLGRRERLSAILGEESDGILDRMAATPDLGDRMALLDDLYEAVVGKVGGQAAELVACLPYPEMAR